MKAHAADPNRLVDAKLREDAAVNADVLYTELSKRDTSGPAQDQEPTRYPE